MEKHSNEQVVSQHFDQLASQYDTLKYKNWYYYRSLMNVISEVIPPDKKVLEIGTGTGEILNFLKPHYGVGIDLSHKMIQRAQEKFPHLKFESCSYEKFWPKDTFEYILLADVIEHLVSPEKLFSNLKRFCGPKTKVVLTMANPSWEPLLDVLEKMHLKMEEGPHFRISEKETMKLAKTEDFCVVSRTRHLLLPIYLPFISPFINNYLIKIPPLRRGALIIRLIFNLNNSNL